MMPGEIEYYRPDTISEAVTKYVQLKQQNKQPLYYSGGTEIITFKRIHYLQTGAVIDIKRIPECNVIGLNGDFIIIGAALPLTLLEEKNYFPLLSETSKEVADHTARNKITLGGNICGNIFYREAVLPFLLTDSQVMIAGYDGIKHLPIHTIFHQKLNMNDGQFLVQLITEKTYTELPYLVIKIRQQWQTGYPLITFAALKKKDEIRIAFSGLCPYPFRSAEIERVLNNRQLSIDERINQSIPFLPSPILNDVEGSKNYRIFVFRHTVLEILSQLEGR